MYRHNNSVFRLAFALVIPILVVALECPATAYTLTVTADHGSVTVTPQKADYAAGEVVELIPKPDVGYCFAKWGGDTHSKKLVLNLTMDSNKTIMSNFESWTPPIGIPTPEFGIVESYRMYDDSNNRNPELTYHQNSEGGYCTHYVDSTHPNATDASNPFGSASQPRKSIPQNVPAGSVIEIHHSSEANNYNSTECNCTGIGTSSMPIFVRGVDEPHIPFYLDVGFAGDTTYMVVEGISFFGGYMPGRQGDFATTYISIRDCEFHGDENSGGVAIGPWQSDVLNHIHHVVFYNNTIHDNGIWDPNVAEGDRGIGGLAIQSNLSYIWALDNHIYHNEMNGIQVVQSAAMPNTDPRVSHHIYLGRNIAHHNKEVGFWTKTALDVVFSENVAYGHRPSQSAAGAGLGFQYDPKRVWFLYNITCDNEIGIQCGSGNTGGRDEFYFIGNVVYNDANGISLNGLNPPSPAQLIGNTIYNTENGIHNGWYTCKLNIVNNIIAASTYQVYFPSNYGTAASSTMSYNLLQGPVNIWWGGGNYTSLSQFQQATGDGAHCVEGDPLFVNSLGTDFRLQAASLATDAGIESEVYQRFHDLYGIDITKDVEERIRPQGGDWDIGAYEYVLNGVDDLSASGTSQNSVTSTWTVPGGDGDSDRPGRYDIRYAETAITEGSWDAATQVQGEPVPGEGGEAEFFTLTDLEPGTTYYVAITTSNNTGTTVSDLSNIVSATTTGSGNRAPVFNPIGDQSATEGVTLSLVVNATDADAGDTLSYSAPSVPSGAAFVAAPRTFAWTPAFEQIGVHYATFEVTDGQVTVSETIAITVYSGTNHPPVLGAIGNKSVNENALLSFSVSAADVDGQSLTYSAGSLPSGASFAGQTFTWTPGFTQAGSHDVAFTVSDGSAQDSETITISVANVNRAPVLAAVSDRNVNENALLTFSVSGTDPDGDSVSFSATGLPGGANFVSGTFSWVPTFNQAGSYVVTFTATDGGLTDSDQATIVVANVNDTTAPVASATYPEADAIQVPLNALIEVTVSDPGWGWGIDADTVELRVDGQEVYSGNTATYDSAYGTCRRTGTQASYNYSYQPDDDFDFDEQVPVSVSASDLAGNAMTAYAYSFTTEMRAFGFNRSVSWGPSDVDKGGPATVCDSSGTIWAVYHAGPVGQRDIYISKMAVNDSNFAGPAQLTTDSGDQGHPSLAIGSDDKLYVVWQDDRRGNWDIYARTSADGVNWSTATRITESDDNQIAPVVAVDRLSPSTAWVAWQDDSAGHYDIYVASSTNDFLTNTSAGITSSTADQTNPDIAVDASGAVCLVWTDARNGSEDIYGADSDTGPWTNVAVATGIGSSQHSPCIATEATGTVLHLAWAWVDEASGDGDIRYAVSDGMPSGSLAGTNIIDDTSGAEQTAPTLAVSGSTGAGLDIFVCWQDGRNVTSGGVDTDLYFADVEMGNETNILVGDGGTSSSQSEPAIGVDAYGYPYVVWTDGRNVNVEIYYAGSSHADAVELASETVAAAGGTVGVASPSVVGDVSVVIPAGACSHEVTVSIAEMANPQFASSSVVLAYEFGPSGLQFSVPVTITIPYAVADFPDGTPRPYWYDSQTGSLVQQGITDIESIVLSDTIHALRFRTTHFTPYGLFDTVVSPTGGGGGGGCALSPSGPEDFAGFVLPYLVVAVSMAILKRRDRKLYQNADR